MTGPAVPADYACQEFQHKGTDFKSVSGETSGGIGDRCDTCPLLPKISGNICNGTSRFC